MILTVGADLCVCPARNADCPGSADISPVGQGSHAGLPLRFPHVIIIAVGYYYPIAMIMTGDIAGTRQRRALPGAACPRCQNH